MPGVDLSHCKFTELCLLCDQGFWDRAVLLMGQVQGESKQRALCRCRVEVLGGHRAVKTGIDIEKRQKTDLRSVIKNLYIIIQILIIF